MERKEIEERFLKVVTEVLGVAESQVKSDTDFDKDLCADSLDLVEMLMRAEWEFDINLDESQMEGIRTFGEAVDYLETKLKEL
jgi:acyl carrier protein